MTTRMSQEERRAQIARGMIQAMAEHGYERATIQRIAEAAGVTPGLIHYHFEGKQALLLAVLEELERRLMQRFEHALRARSPAQDPERADAHARLDAWVQAHVGLDERGPDAEAMGCWVAISAEAPHLPEVREVFEQVTTRQLDELTAILEACLAERGADDIEMDQLRRGAAGLLASVQGALSLGQAAPGALPPGFAAPALRRAAEAFLTQEGNPMTRAADAEEA